jgi:hypothetical protein
VVRAANLAYLAGVTGVVLFTGACVRSQETEKRDAGDASAEAQASDDAGASDKDSSAGDGKAASDGGAGGVGGSGDTKSTDNSPGESLMDPEASGGGPCSGRDLSSVIDAIREDHPELEDIQIFYDQLFLDNSYIYPYQKPDGGFAIVFRRGWGDCPSGCSESEYWYFETDEACTPVQVGHYRPTYNDQQPCIEQDGLPMWGRPPTPDPIIVCDSDLSPEDISGSYRFTAIGQHLPCTVGTFVGDVDIRLEVDIEIEQSPDAPDTGTVIIEGTGDQLVDGRVLPASFTRRRFSVHEQESNLPASCPQEHQLDVSYDFEGFAPGVIALTEFGTPDCENAPLTFCRGSLQLALELIE